MADYDATYRSAPVWDIGEPQPAILELADRRGFDGPVLDVGCGTGEHALLAASRGCPAVGIDLSAAAIDAATRKAAARALTNVAFRVYDAAHVDVLGGPFDTVLDVGYLHLLASDARVEYLRKLAQVVPARGCMVVLAISSESSWGDTAGGHVNDQGHFINVPHPLHDDDVYEAFDRAGGWALPTVTRSETVLLGLGAVPAWLVTATRS